MARQNNRFSKGFLSVGGCYECRCCGKKTRETGSDESSVELCAYCYHEAGWENMLADGNCTQAEFDKGIADLRKQYNRPTPQQNMGHVLVSKLINAPVLPRPVVVAEDPQVAWLRSIGCEV